MHRLLTLLAAGLLLSPCIPVRAQDDADDDGDRSQRWPRKHQGRTTDADARGLRLRRARARRIMARLRQRDPEAYKRLQKLHEEDPEKFHRELQQHETPGLRVNRVNAGTKGRQQGFSVRVMERVREQDPERWQRLRRQREQDPDEARKMMRQMVAGFNRHYFGRNPRVLELAAEYHRTDDPEKRKAITAELREMVAADFDKRRAARREHIEQMIAQLEAMLQKLQHLDEIKTEVCRKRMDALLDPDKFELMAPEQRGRRGQGGQH